jgi:hypothetical protein
VFEDRIVIVDERVIEPAGGIEGTDRWQTLRRCDTGVGKPLPDRALNRVSTSRPDTDTLANDRDQS